MKSELVLAFSVGGGSPPATSELLRIYQDGRAVALVGNAWPEGQPQDEAGLYAMQLLPAELEYIKRFLAEERIFALEAEYGPLRMDSGFNTLQLFGEGCAAKIKWGPFAKIPNSLRELRAHLRGILLKTRQQPVQTVQVELGMASAQPVLAGASWPIEFKISNRGTQPVRVQMAGGEVTSSLGDSASALRFYTVPVGEKAEGTATDAPPPLEYLYYAQAVTPDNPADLQLLGSMAELAPGATWRVCAVVPCPSGGAGPYSLYGFTEPRIEVILDGKLLTVECFIVTRPVIIEQVG